MKSKGHKKVKRHERMMNEKKPMSGKHADAKEDKKMIKEMIKKGCMK